AKGIAAAVGIDVATVGGGRTGLAADVETGCRTEARVNRDRTGVGGVGVTVLRGSHGAVGGQATVRRDVTGVAYVRVTGERQRQRAVGVIAVTDGDRTAVADIGVAIGRDHDAFGGGVVRSGRRVDVAGVVDAGRGADAGGERDDAGRAVHPGGFDAAAVGDCDVASLDAGHRVDAGG